MVARKIVVGISCAALLSAVAFFCLLDDSKKALETSQVEQPKKVVSQKVAPQPAKPKHRIADMYNSTVYDLPLYSIYEISNMPTVLKSEVDKVLEEAQGLYLLKYNKDEQKVFMILQNQITSADAFPRHNLEFMELYLNSEDGKVLKNLYSPAYIGIPNEAFLATYEIYNSDEAWELDKKAEVTRPLKHTVFDQRGKIKNVELWNYDEDKEIKYQLKGSSKNVLSILKEYRQGDDGLRKEHLFYNSDGALMLSLSINFEGANITRMMYFDKHNTEESASIIAHYFNGMKVKEEVYGNDYKLLNTVEAEYSEAQRTKIKIYDSEGKLLDEIGK